MRYLILTVIATCLIACKNESDNPGIAPGDAKLLDAQPGSAPFVTADSKGNILVSWVRRTGHHAGEFCYAVSTDSGASFGAPIIIPASSNIQPHAENLPKIVAKPSGDLMALWGAANPNPRNKYSGLVYYSQSFDNGKTWTESRRLVTDTAGFDQRYYDVALLPDNEIGIIWLDNRKTGKKEGSGLFYATTNGRSGFVNEQKITEECCQCCRTDLFIDSKKNMHILYRGIMQDSIRDVVHIFSTDGGKTFSKPGPISNDNWVIRGCPHTGPAMTENEAGLHFAWFTGGRKKGSFYTSSADNGSTFKNEQRVSEAGSHPQMATVGGRPVITWDETIRQNDSFYKRIGIQERDADGKVRMQGFITAENSTASHPVIKEIDNRTAIIVYTEKQQGLEYVKYQRIRLK